jgi:hypothetical protein
MVGGIFIKTNPRPASIFIDGKFKKTTDPFLGSALIENLFPKKYRVTVKKEGYIDWEKEVEVGEGKVTEFKNVILFPKNLNFNPILKNVEDFWISPDGKNLILRESEEGKWALKVYSLEKKLKFSLAKQDDFSKEAQFLKLKFNDKKPEELELEIQIKDQVKNFLFDLRKIPPEFREKEKIQVPETFLCYEKIEKNYYHFDKSGYFFKGEERMNEKPLEGINECNLKIFDDLILLESGGKLFLLNEGRFEKIFENLSGVEKLPGSKNLAIFSSSEIWILKNGKVEFLNRFSDKITNLYWINDDYLIFSLGNRIKISETERVGGLNVYDLGEVPEGKFFFSSFEKKIYFKKDGSIFESISLLR